MRRKNNKKELTENHIQEIKEEIISEEVKEEIISEEVKEEIISEEVKEEIISEEVKEEIISEEVKEEIISEEVKEEIISEEVKEEIISEEIKDEIISEEIKDEIISEEKTLLEKELEKEKRGKIIDKTKEKDYQILDSSEATGEHKKRGRKKGSTNASKENKTEPEQEEVPFDKDEMFQMFIEFIEKTNGTVTSFITGKEPERYNFNPMAKGFLFFVASKQRKFFLNLKFISETWFFLASILAVLIATHVQVIFVDMQDKRREREEREKEEAEKATTIKV